MTVRKAAEVNEGGLVAPPNRHRFHLSANASPAQLEPDGDFTKQEQTNEKCIMTTIIEKDSFVVPLLVLAFVLLTFLGGGLGLAYIGGVFTGKNDVIENDKRIANQASMIPRHP